MAELVVGNDMSRIIYGYDFIVKKIITGAFYCPVIPEMKER